MEQARRAVLPEGERERSLVRRTAARGASVWRSAGSTPLLLAVGGLLVLATGFLLWLGYRATSAQARSDRLLVDRRARETLALLVSALDRDMKGAQLSVLLQLGPTRPGAVSVADLATQASAAFGRFPYIETIFLWHDRPGTRDMPYVLNRADRPPPWDTGDRQAAAYPVVTRHGHPVLASLVDRIRADSPFTKRFAVYRVSMADTSYQVVVYLVYDTVARRPGLVSVVGYTVNLAWTRAHYFDEIVTQVSAMAGEGQSTVLSIADATGHVVATTAAVSDGRTHARRFPLAFFDERLTAVIPDTQGEMWTAAARPREGASDPAAVSGQRLFMLMALAALASVAALMVLARALQVRDSVAAMKAEFVSTVTHELKTPLSLMRLVADSLVAGRYRDPEKIPKYGELLSAEVRRMTHLVDNILSYARLSSVYNDHVAAPIDLVELLAAMTADWQPRLTQQGFTMGVEVGTEPLLLSGDRTALMQALNNLIDNAVKYSSQTDARTITVRARRDGQSIQLRVEDCGTGIHPDDLPRVRERFIRGRDTRTGGSGLGLAIVSRVVNNHRGTLEIRSALGRGTTVIVSLPAD